MMRSRPTLILGLALFVLGSLPSRADTVDAGAVMAGSPMASVLMGEDLERSRNRHYPFHISLQVPDTSGAVSVAAIFPEAEGEALAEFIYHVGGEHLLEMNTISYATINDGTPDERLQFIYNVIEGQVYPSIQPPPDANVLGGRRTQVGPYPAVEFISIYTTEEAGEVSARIVGVVPPSGPDVLIFVQTTALSRLGITNVNALSGTFGGRILDSMQFIARRDDSGVLLPF